MEQVGEGVDLSFRRVLLKGFRKSIAMNIESGTFAFTLHLRLYLYLPS